MRDGVRSHSAALVRVRGSCAGHGALAWVGVRLTVRAVRLQDAKGKAYYWHGETNKVQWAKPTADTPIK